MSAQTSVLDGPQDGTFKRLPDALPPSHSLTVRAADGTPLHTEVFGPPDGYPIVLKLVPFVWPISAVRL